MDLHTLWFLLLGTLLAGYAVLDGFDFGVGMLSVLTREDRDKRALLRAIGPIWDGNEVWLVTFGGSMFAAFPEVYATVFSGFYVAFMAVLFALILRALAIEFRNRGVSPLWHAAWDLCFFLSSLAATLLFGIAVGVSVLGVPLDANGILRARLVEVVFPPGHAWYPLLIGVLTASLFMVHGGLYLLVKVQTPLVTRVRGWVWRALAVFIVLYLVASIATLTTVPRAWENMTRLGWGWIAVALSGAAIAVVVRGARVDKPWQAFAGSSALIVCLVALVGVALFPDLVVSSAPAGTSLTIYNASSSEKTLRIMTLIALLGMPFLLSYTAIVFWTFRVRVRSSG